MEFSEKIIGLEKKNKMISLEYFLGIVLAFSLWGYHLINTAVISQDIASKSKYYEINEDNYRISGLYDSYFGLKRDFTDHQWRSFRQSLPIIYTFAGIFLILSNVVKKFAPSQLKVYYLIMGLGYAIYLHYLKIVFLLMILLLNFYLTRMYSLLGSKLFTLISWVFPCSMKVFSEIYRGFSFRNIIPGLDEHAELSWHLVYGLILLRMISFNMEYKSLLQKNKVEKEVNTSIIFSEEGNTHCKDCEQRNFCLKFLQDSPTRQSDYSLMNYMIYVFYPPLYFSGPTVLFNSFIYQVNNFSKSQHQNLFNREKIIYIIRYILVFISFEIFNSFVFVNAYLTNIYNKELWAKFDYYTFTVFCVFLLIFIWFKFTLIWRTSRIWAWVDGIYVEENMNRCVYNGYCFESFWRAWHRSFNVWLIKYIFIPLGGSKYKIANIWVVFSFVALWHDLQWHLLIWGWFICLFLMPEIVVKNYFNQEKMKYIHDYMWFRMVKYFFCAFYTLLMIIANLIGFGMGHEGLVEILKNMLKMTSFAYFIKIIIFLIPNVVVVYYVREKEALNDKNKNKF